MYMGEIIELTKSQKEKTNESRKSDINLDKLISSSSN